jgi:hypothetical protein
VGLRYEDLDDITRRYMLEEIDMDIRADTIYRSPWLSQTGQGRWPDMLRASAVNGTDASLADQIRNSGLINRTAQRKAPKGYGTVTYNVPITAPETMAEGEFNRYYARGLCRRAIDSGLSRLEVYRAKAVLNPRAESEEKIGLLVDPTAILTDLRVSQGVETALGIPPGPNSGISLRIRKA